MTKQRDRELKGRQLAALEAELLKGTPAPEAVKLYATRAGVAERQGWKDLALLKKGWAARATAASGSAEEAGRSAARLEMVFVAALAAGDLPTALAAERARAELLGLCRAAPAPGGAAAGGSASPI